ncbi:hypothetical protein PBN151_1196 [Paenibacillus sp. NAIST15-1]|nr:hypothetical protein PBN151_1196 [Paenibacillus sp. NAIST15-1]
MGFYVSESKELPKLERNENEHSEKWRRLEQAIEEMKTLYYKKLASFDDIAKTYECNWWDIKTLFRKYNLTTISLKERARLNRKRDFETIYDLHYNQKKTLTEIYRDYGFVPQHVRTTLKEHGYAVINYQRLEK